MNKNNEIEERLARAEAAVLMLNENSRTLVELIKNLDERIRALHNITQAQSQFIFAMGKAIK